MAVVGRACLIVALATAVYGVGASLYGARRGEEAWVLSGRRAVFVLAGVLTLAFAILEGAFWTNNFHFDVVAGHSSLATPAFYKLAAAWSSQAGSLLLWVWLLSLWSSLALVLIRGRLRAIAPYATATLLGFAIFFCALTVFFANPFDYSATAPLDGTGLNPLLRHASMMIHPPMLYSGYTLTAIPFAFAIGALVTRRLGAEWLHATRRFALGGWLCLGVGIMLGARWSFTELGWGGYWGWDPVENASLMPWLTATAFIHSSMIQEKRGMLKVWNVSLVLATGVLAILGTFLVRSGILDSIHAFGASTLGVPFLSLLGVMIAGSIGLVVSRRGLLRSEHRLESLLSRESIFLVQNLVLVAVCFVVFWGTFFPLISEAVTGTKASVGPPWFDRYITPLGILLVALTGIGPAIAWRRGTAANLRRNFALPVVCGVGCVVALIAAGVTGSTGALALFACAAFAVATAAQELWRGTRARRAAAGEVAPRALVALVRRNRRRYGGYIVHVGFAVILVGIAASTAFQHARDVRLTPGQTAHVGGYDVRYVRPVADQGAGKIGTGALVAVSRNGHPVGTLRTLHDYYSSHAPFADGLVGEFFAGDPETEVGLQAGLRRDLWVAIRPDIDAVQARARAADRALPRGTPRQIAGAVQRDLRGIVADYLAHPGAATFRVIVDPLVSWIWIGGMILALGALIALWPGGPGRRGRRRSEPMPAAAPAAARSGEQGRQGRELAPV